METIVDFSSQVFAFIENTYGKSIIKKVKLKKNKDVVDRILSDSQAKEYTVDRTGHKLMAMLRIIP